MSNDDTVSKNLANMDALDFQGWNNADWHGKFSDLHTDDVKVEFSSQPVTHGLGEHIDAMVASVDMTGGTPTQVVSHPTRFGQDDWTCVVGELPDGSRMVTVAKWIDGRISEEYIWA